MLLLEKYVLVEQVYRKHLQCNNPFLLSMYYQGHLTRISTSRMGLSTNHQGPNLEIIAAKHYAEVSKLCGNYMENLREVSKLCGNLREVFETMRKLCGNLCGSFLEIHFL